MHDLAVKSLYASDIPSILAICAENGDYYVHINEVPSLLSVTRTFESLPPGAKISQKTNLGFYVGTELAAYVEMVKAYPEDSCALIGLLMVKKEYQGKGLGGQVVSLTLDSLRNEGCSSVYLSCSSTNESARNFWVSRGFVETGDIDEYDDIALVAMKHSLS